MRKNKMTHYLIIVTLIASLFSVGFASWVTANSVSLSTNGMIVVEDVMKSNEFITCSTDGITQLSFFKNGFVDNDGKIASTGTIKANLTVNIDNCKTKFSDCNTLQIDISLFEEELALFNDEINMKISPSVKLGDTNLDVEITKNNQISRATFNIDNFKSYNSNITLEVTYEFEILNFQGIDNNFENTYFIKNIYPKLISNNFNFTLRAKLTGIV